MSEGPFTPTRCDDVAMHVVFFFVCFFGVFFFLCDEATRLRFHTVHEKNVISTLSDLYMCSQIRNMSYASDNCRDGFSACSNAAVCEHIIKMYSVLIFLLVALLHRSLARSLALCVKGP